MPIKQKAIKNIRNETVCEKCKHKEEFPNGFPCWRCIGIDLANDLFVSEKFFVMEKITNYDLLVSKSPEQLAHTLWLTAKGGIIGQRSEDEWLDWLKREAKEE